MSEICGHSVLKKPPNSMILFKSAKTISTKRCLNKTVDLISDLNFSCCTNSESPQISCSYDILNFHLASVIPEGLFINHVDRFLDISDPPPTVASL